MKHVLNFTVGFIVLITCPIWMPLAAGGMAVGLVYNFGAELVEAFKEGIKEGKNAKK
jgi:hypothetical protein